MTINKLKIISWNLLHRSGALVDEISSLIDTEQPDLILMQEATAAIDALPSIVGGDYHRQPWPKRHHGLATWSSSALRSTTQLPLSFSRIPGSFPQRMAQLLQVDDITIANVHLSHGQILNRRQLLDISCATSGPTAIIGDYNAIGPTKLDHFSDVGPKGATHNAQELIPFRLDRCMIRDLRCIEAKKLDRGASDHKPIVVELEALHAR